MDLCAQVIANTLVEYGSVSGLRANRLKSNIFLAGVSGADREAIGEVLGYAQGVFPFRYLGIPLAANRLRGVDYSLLVEKISDLIKTWTNLTLSYAGRLELYTICGPGSELLLAFDLLYPLHCH